TACRTARTGSCAPTTVTTGSWWRTSRWRRSSRSSCRAETPPPTPRPPATLNRFVRYFQRPVVPAGIDPPRAVTNATGRRSPAVEEAHAELVGGLLQHLLHGK